MAAKPIPPGGLRKHDQGESLVTGNKDDEGVAASGERDSQGRFVKGAGGDDAKPKPKPAETQPAKAEGEPKPAAQTQGGSKPPLQPAKILPDGKIVIAGKVFDDIQHVQKVLLSRSGDTSKHMKEVNRLQAENTQLRTQYIAAVDVANQHAKYTEAYMNLQNSGQAPPMGQAPNPQQGMPHSQGNGSAQPPNSAADSPFFNMATYETIKAKLGPGEAEAYYRTAMAKDREALETRMRQSITSEFSPRLEQIEAHSKRMADISNAQRIIVSAAQMTGPDGQPRYPELRDPAAREAVVRNWAKLPENLRFGEDARGIRLAVMDYRDNQETTTPQRADEDDLGLGDLENYSAFTMEGEGGGVPRPADEGDPSHKADLAAKELVFGRSDAGPGDMEGGGYAFEPMD